MKTIALRTTLPLLLCLPTLQAQESSADQAAELAKQLSNPISSLISVPFQANWDFGIGTTDATRFTLNVQPVIPISLSSDWNLVLRTIVPIIDAESPAPGIDDASGLGDTTQSFFFSPKAPGPGGIIWGAGPVALYPTATDSLLGSEKWGLGPTFVALKQTGAWTVGVLANHIWSVGGDGDRADVSSSFLQPFAAYTTKSHTTFTLNSEATYNWEEEEWSVPLNFIVSQVFKVGSQPMQFGLGGRYYVESPEGGPEWGVRAVFTLLFPTAKHAPPAAHPASTK